MHPTNPPCASRSLAIRVRPGNPDHHLWSNHGAWWIHYVVHEGHRKLRIRHSLGTGDLTEARARRDALFAAMATTAGLAS